jgi:hypothetical protein
MRGGRLEQKVYSEMEKQGDGGTYEQKTRGGGGHSEANAAARKAGGSRMMAQVQYACSCFGATQEQA